MRLLEFCVAFAGTWLVQLGSSSPGCLSRLRLLRGMPCPWAFADPDTMQMKSLQSLLAVREGHTSPQLQVLASMVGAHSRLGSITDKLAQALQTWQPLGELPSCQTTIPVP